MKKLIIIIILFSSISWAQEIFIGNAILYSVAAGYTEGLRRQENSMTNDPETQWRVNSLWHNTSLLERGLGICLGITIALHSKFKWKKILAGILLSGAIYWNLFDGTINLTTGRPFYYISDSTPAIKERFGSLKIPVLLAAVFIEILVDNKIL